jgi:6-phosphogluconolactonase (cycloisomerase 2 family)
MTLNGTGDGAAAIYVQTNERESNKVIAFRRAANGSLTSLGTFDTGGAGLGAPHLTSQGSVVLTGDGRHLLVTNATSDDISVFAVRGEGLELIQTFATGGSAPKSATEHEGLVYVLNTGTPSLTGFRLGDAGLEAIEGSERRLSEDADPAQVGFGPDGATLIVTERGTNSIAVYAVEANGRLGESRTQPSSGPTPYGFATSSTGTLIVTEAFGAQRGKAAASSYVIGDGSIKPVTRSLGNGRSEICWAVVTNDDRYAFTTNFADGAVSRYALSPDGSIMLEDAVAGVAVEGETGLRDEELTSDGRFLYAIDADSRRIFGWAVGDGGQLDPVGSWDGLPATVAGLAAS